MNSRAKQAVVGGGLVSVVACGLLMGSPVLAQSLDERSHSFVAPAPAVAPSEAPASDWSASLASTLIYGHGPGDVYTVEMTTGGVSTLGWTQMTLTDVALAPDGTLYGISFEGLYKVNTRTGDVLSLPAAFPVPVNALVWSPDGALLAAGGDSLLRVELPSGITTTVGRLGIPYASAGDLEFGADGALYLAATGGSTSTTKLLKVNPSTGSAYVVGDTGFQGVSGLVRTHDGRLLGGTETGTFIQIDTSTGKGTAVFSTGKMLWGLSGAPILDSSDTTPPVITTPGHLTLECTGPSTPVSFRVSAVDDVDGAVPVSCRPGSATYPVGTTLNLCTASDAAGNVATAGFPVTVRDTAAPNLLMRGDSFMALECGMDTYVDPGATAHDVCSGNLEVHRYNSGQDAYGPGPNTAAEGTYSVQYIAWDAMGYTESAIRTVKVSDTLAPTLRLNGPAALTLSCGSTFVDPGATATDRCYGDLAPSILRQGWVEPRFAGTYTLSYSVRDGANHSAPPVSRTVTVVDDLGPVVGTRPVKLWPASGDLRTVHLSECAVASDACEYGVDLQAQGTITSISSDEPEDAQGNGDGTTLGDIVLVGRSAFQLRAERGTSGNGRVYTVRFTVKDRAGNATNATCRVQVPMSESGMAVDDGAGAGYEVFR